MAPRLLLNTLSALLMFQTYSSFVSGESDTLVKQEIRIPQDVRLTEEDTYMCTTVKLPSQPMKLVGVQPQASMDVVHHILLFGCGSPHMIPEDGKPQPAWECGAVCSDSYQILYGWGRNAPLLELPLGVGFSVGEESAIKYIVAQVHFLSKDRPADDASGVTLMLKPTAVPFSAGVISFASGFTIPPQKPSYLVETECCYQGHQPLTTFAMRVHTHTLGHSVLMTRETWNHSGLETIGQRSPQLPQAFVPVARSIIYPGDKLKVTCDFDSTTRTKPTFAGGTHNDEMCNMYMMVYGWQPFNSMCTGSFGLNDQSPGAMPITASFVEDPSPFWKPPDPKTNKLGSMSGLVVAEDSSLWGLYRGERTWNGTSFDAKNRVTASQPISEAVVVRMDADTGRVISSWGKDIFYMPHMLTIDRERNVWVVDCGLHQVLKFSPTGKLLMEVGTKLEPGSDSAHFCKPTKVAIMRDGTFFVADGYCNSRVVKFSKDGRYISEAAIRDGQVVHHVLLDECNNLLYVASRENGLVTSFAIDTLEVKMRIDLSFGGRVWSLLTRPNGGVLALTWELNKPARIVNVLVLQQVWQLPDALNNQYPHEAVLGPAPLALSGAAERLQALYIVPTCPPDKCGRLQRLVLLPAGRQLPSAAAIAASGPHPLPREPPAPLIASSDSEMKDATNGAMSTMVVIGSGKAEDEEGDTAAQNAGDKTVSSTLEQDKKEEEKEEEEYEKVVEEEEEEAEAEYEKEVEEEEEEELKEASKSPEEKRVEEEKAEEEDKKAEKELDEEEEEEEEEREAEKEFKEEEKEEEMEEEEEVKEMENEKEAEEKEEEEEVEREREEEKEEEEAEEEEEEEADAEYSNTDESQAEIDYEEEKKADEEENKEKKEWDDAHKAAVKPSSKKPTPDRQQADNKQPSASGSAATLELVDTHEAPPPSSSGQVVVILLAAALAASVVVAGALFVMRQYAAPSTLPGSSGAHQGFEPIQEGRKVSKPMESIAEMLSNSETLEFEEDVEAQGSKPERRVGTGHLSSSHRTSGKGK